jgi:Mrp family chromosome partitioning ATPase
MTTIGFFSAKHSPGVTTSVLACGLALSSRQRVTIVELDHAGGDLASMCSLSQSTGLTSFATAVRHNTDAVVIDDHLQHHGDVGVIVSPVSPIEASATIAKAGLLAIHHAASDADLTIVDLGRIDSTTSETLAVCDIVVAVTRPTVTSVSHMKARIERCDNLDLRLLVVGSKPYSPHEVADALGIPLAGALPMTERYVDLLTSDPSNKALHRSELLRSAGSIDTATRRVKMANVS